MMYPNIRASHKTLLSLPSLAVNPNNSELNVNTNKTIVEKPVAANQLWLAQTKVITWTPIVPISSPAPVRQLDFAKDNRIITFTSVGNAILKQDGQIYPCIP